MARAVLVQPTHHCAVSRRKCQNSFRLNFVITANTRDTSEVAGRTAPVITCSGCSCHHLLGLLLPSLARSVPVITCSGCYCHHLLGLLLLSLARAAPAITCSGCSCHHLPVFNILHYCHKVYIYSSHMHTQVLKFVKTHSQSH